MSSPKRRICDQRGAALFSALVFLTALSALAAAYAMNVRANLALTGAGGVRRSAFYAAEAGLNYGITNFANIFRNSGTPEGLDFEQSLTLEDKRVEIDIDEAPNCAPCPSTRIPDGEVFGGLNTIPYRYVVQSVSKVPPGDSTAHVAGEFDIHNIPIFQFLAFVDSHLFVMPLPDMTLHGRLHTNGDLYLQPDNGLWIQDDPPDMPNVQVTAVGNVYRGGRKYDSNWRCTGTTIIDKLEDIVSPDDDLDPKTLSCSSGSGASSPLSASTIAQWKGSIKNNVRNITTPPVEIIDRGDGEYWENADLRIVLNLNTAPYAINFGSPLLCPGANGTMTSPALYPIEVHTAAGGVDVTKTAHLWRFMCQRRGALFYNDIPTNAPTPPNNNTAIVSTAANYNPPFATNQRVYRRVGEDTSGDGNINATDNNVDICPAGSGASPWYRPSYCAWPLTGGSVGTTSWYNDMDYRRGAFWNHRAQMWMMMLNINLRALLEWNQVNGSPLFPYNDSTDGGLVFFVTVSGPQSDAALNNYATRIFDSADLDTRNTTFPTTMSDPTGITVVSDQAILIQGNFNKKDKFPAAILADAIWILSQGWEVPANAGAYRNDLKSVFDLSTNWRNVPASDWPGTASFSSSSALTLNAALLFGIGPSTRNPDWYNGGLENFPKFLESWDGRTLNYRGSFVSLGLPRHKESNWACGSGDDCMGSGVYDPPTREYDYDADFNEVENLPPMTPKVVYVQQRIYTRIYE